MSTNTNAIYCDRCESEVQLRRKTNTGVLVAECDCDQVATRVAEAVPLAWEVANDE